MKNVMNTMKNVMQNIVKKLGVSNYLWLASFVLTFVGIILYASNITVAGYFYAASVTEVAVCGSLALILALVLALKPLLEIKNEKIDLIVNFALDVLKVVVCVFLFMSMMELINNRAEGIAYILFPNDDVAVTVAKYKPDVYVAISSAIMFGISGIVALVASFFKLERKQKAEQEQKALEA